MSRRRPPRPQSRMNKPKTRNVTRSTGVSDWKQIYRQIQVVLLLLPIRHITIQPNRVRYVLCVRCVYRHRVPGMYYKSHQKHTSSNLLLIFTHVNGHVKPRQESRFGAVYSISIPFHDTSTSTSIHIPFSVPGTGIASMIGMLLLAFAPE